MTPEHRTFNERYTRLWTERAAARRRSGTRVDLAIAGALDRIVASMRAELDAAGPPVVEDEKITWKSPVFNVGGRFNPFAGTYAEQMLASAAVCDRLGYPQYGDGFRAHAARGVPLDGDDGEHRLDAKRLRDAAVWSGPPMPPAHDPEPFTAGEQMGFGL